MTYTNEELNDIYDITDGRCHICRKRLSFKNYGVHGARGAWHIDHSVPRAKGGSNRRSNLKPACISCNLEKAVGSTRAARQRMGYTSAPLSAAKRRAAQRENAILAGAAGAALGSRLGLPGALIGGVVGAVFGGSADPER